MVLKYRKVSWKDGCLLLTQSRGQRIEREVHNVEEKAKEVKETVKEKLTDTLPDVIPHVSKLIIWQMSNFAKIKELKEEIQREIHQELVRDGLEEESEVPDKYKKNFQRIIKESSENNTKVFEIDEEPVIFENILPFWSFRLNQLEKQQSSRDHYSLKLQKEKTHSLVPLLLKT